MTLQPGTRLGPYEVLSAIGAGGMGEVYRAHDTKLRRDVALKVIPDAFALDPDRLARFKREAEVLASINHPHIAAIYGFEDSGDTHALVLELVGGDTLADRIARGAIPLEEALAIGRQICEALEAAHEQGIVHRDLKPANIKITADGVVKVLDFGLAKLAAEGGTANHADPAASPTITSPAMMTGVGVILGTAAYMAPEQAKGRQADKRSDIWAFGCLLYEMLTGRASFEGENVPDILSKVLQRDPDWTRVPPNVPTSVHRLMRLCLEKDPKKRRQAAGDVRIDIDQALAEASPAAPSVRTRGPLPARLAWISSAVALTAALAIPAAIHLRETPPAEMRLQIVTPPTRLPLHFALSPNGRYIVFAASESSTDATQRLYLRALDKTDAQPMAGTDGATYPFWSPDSRSVGFFASGSLKRVDISGGPAQMLAPTPAPQGGAWHTDGTILYAPNTVSPLLRIPASGGESVAVTRLDSPRQLGHVRPSFLPAGRQFLFYATGEPDVSGIYLGSLGGPESTRLTAADSHGEYLPPDRLAFVRQGDLVVRPLDAARAELTGDPATVIPSVGAFSIAATGMLAYRAGDTSRTSMSWFDRTGKALGQAPAPLNGPELSPDESRVTGDRTVQGNRDVWIEDLVRGGLTRFTFHAAVDGFPIWSPDGSQVIFESTRNGTFDLWIKPSNGAAEEQLLLESPDTEWPLSWSQDGRFLLFQRSDLKTQWDLWALPMTGADRTPIVVANTSFTERMGQFSPDGRWVAYETNESGRQEIVAQRFPEAGAKWQVSTGGGIAPRWRADGREIYFIAPDGKMMAVPITMTGSTFEAGKTEALFSSQIVPQPFKAQYTVSGDGRFLINNLTEEQSSASPITLILNWKP